MTPSYQKRLIERVNKLYNLIRKESSPVTTDLHLGTQEELNLVNRLLSEITALKGFVEALEEEK